MKLLSLFAALGIFAGTVLAADAPKIAPKDAAKLVAAGKAVLVDCREAEEWAETGVAAPAVLLPKSDLDGDGKQWKAFLAKNEGKQVLIYCASGFRANAVAAELNEQGLRAANVGGFKGWAAASLPTRKIDAPKPAGK